MTLTYFGHHTTGVAFIIRAVDINAIHTVFVAELADINGSVPYAGGCVDTRVLLGRTVAG